MKKANLLKMLLSNLFISGIFALSVFQLNASCVFNKPIEVQALKIGNMITWTTYKESNNDYFAIERSENGVDFTTMGQINGGGTTSEVQNYRYLDLTTGQNKTFYRLQMTDTKGFKTYTETVVFSRDNKNNMIITAMSSTITDRIFSLTVRAAEKINANYNVIDNNNDSVLTGNIELIDGTNVISIDIDGLLNGSYDFVLFSENEIEKFTIKKVDTKDVPTIDYAVKE